ncbi:hypothetical protein L5G32_08110 [Gordonia sp. HY002]|uniref:hypothetical protein n=1 Tax=Gordonia zhenghanii TaxID=2911516 RepID=UPI001EF13EC8|nr:hypothetical protein [Gordonia zhenghanii]MCF8570229.1 hypothetical protein [Gordonia zhenghanii]MCF8607070.1 hypothetical protein [Gordonia zhenghanii]
MITGFVILGVYGLIRLGWVIGLETFAQADNWTEDFLIGVSVASWIVPFLWIVVGLIAAADPAIRSRGAAAGAACLALFMYALLLAWCVVVLLGASNVGDVVPGGLVWRAGVGVVVMLIVAAWLLGHRRSTVTLLLTPVAGLLAAVIGFGQYQGWNGEYVGGSFDGYSVLTIAIIVACCWLAVLLDMLVSPKPQAPWPVYGPR